MAGRNAHIRIRWIKTPRQARSRDKLQRMLDAAEALLQEKNFDQITIAQIARKARVSVGLFYTRFKDKDALLSALYEEHMTELHATTGAALDPDSWTDVPVARFVEELVTFSVQLHRKNRGLLRALVLRHHSAPGSRYQDPAERAKTTIARVGKFLARRANDIPHLNPRLAGSLGFLFVLGAVRERILFDDGAASAVRISDHRLARELTRAFQAYLGLPVKTQEKSS